ncbi:hypothetical protein LMG8520_1950 [Lactococcus lactis subsp. lactis]|uniref:Uncharacterized protein n=1 Tax=Lactococcus lactis subsp. lactis TaxID=1360 RepID=A0A0V8D1A6_LACLL|nr:hypothetical protein LMG8520_1950 [Lactococcus lactis subsp. lactis]
MIKICDIIAFRAGAGRAFADTLTFDTIDFGALAYPNGKEVAT